MPAQVSTWSVANILKLPSSKGLQPGYYPIYAPLDVYNHGCRTCQEPLCSEGRADCKGLEAQTQQRHITGNEFDFLTLNAFYFGSLALVVFACVFLGPTSSRTDHEDPVNLSPLGCPHSEDMNHLRVWGSFQYVGSALPESSHQKFQTVSATQQISLRTQTLVGGGGPRPKKATTRVPTALTQKTPTR